MDDLALLREYAASRSEAAFETLVSRWVRFVYSAALRQVRDPHLAGEVTQAVFIILARKAGTIREGAVLSGWLFKTVRFAALAQSRAAMRRRQREQEAYMQSKIPPDAPNELWEQIAPLLDEGLAQLGEKDRQAVLLRFFEGRSLADVGGRLGMGEDAARMRINRTLDKLRRYFVKRGVDSTADLIAGTISANSLQAIPPGLASTITAAVCKGPAVAAPVMALVKGTLNLMAWLKTKTVIVFGAGALIAGAAVLTLHEQEQQNRNQEDQIRAQEQVLRAEEQQDNLTPERRAELKDEMAQLRTRQDALRVKQNQLYEREPDPVARPSLRLSPFTHVKYDGDKVLVTYDGADYELAGVNSLSTAQMLAFCHETYKDQWQKRFGEDLVIVLSDMGHPITADKTVGLTLVDSKTGETKTIEHAVMTPENRQAVSAALREDGIVKP
jgi:RNA polymerase sigma factor (sigma-70 family)